MDDLHDKVAVVTGAGSGIGRALAQRFAFEGMRLAVADVEADALDETVALLLDAGAQVLARPTDVTDAADVAELAADVYDRFGAAHVLCNNAGVFAGGLLWELDDATVDWVLDVNVRGILHGVRAFVPRMLAGGEPGHVVNTASSAGIFGSPYTGPYTVSKFAAVGMSEVLAWDLSISGAPIGVSVLCPGAVATRIGFSDRNRPAEVEADKACANDDPTPRPVPAAVPPPSSPGRCATRPPRASDRRWWRTMWSTPSAPTGSWSSRATATPRRCGPHRRPARRGAPAADRLHLTA
ncbi:MAG: SDR family NAD(P)-dependent oxidoreductase [Acidimicrobiales bacterium]